MWDSNFFLKQPEKERKKELKNDRSLIRLSVGALMVLLITPVVYSEAVYPQTEKELSTVVFKATADKTTQTQASQKKTRQKQSSQRNIPQEAARINLLGELPPPSLIRDVVLNIDHYPNVTRELPPRFNTASEILAALDNTTQLLIHMELLRRGYHQLPVPEQSRLLERLDNRHKDAIQDKIKAFDLGYAQLVYLDNKSGLFFLRKVNDAIRNQFTSLAYGMAQVDADLNLEHAQPDAMTTRKMDAIYKLGDAVKIDAVRHQNGFWPSFVAVISELKKIKAYNSFSQRDFSLVYVPYGSIARQYVLPTKSQQAFLRQVFHDKKSRGQMILAAKNPVPQKTATQERKTEKMTTCSVNGFAEKTASLTSDQALSLVSVYQHKKTAQSTDKLSIKTTENNEDASSQKATESEQQAEFNQQAELEQSQLIKALKTKTPVARRLFTANGVNTVLQFYETPLAIKSTLDEHLPHENNNLYTVLVESQGLSPIAFNSYVMPKVLEDLDKDGTFEIVVRQYEKCPLNPVLVYRFHQGCGFVRDYAISQQFQ
ncbi:MAG: hypothetical protein AAGI66_04905 [Cyanobacteria bacterium P01_H01_bin.74]